MHLSTGLIVGIVVGDRARLQVDASVRFEKPASEILLKDVVAHWRHEGASLYCREPLILVADEKRDVDRALREALCKEERGDEIQFWRDLWHRHKGCGKLVRSLLSRFQRGRSGVTSKQRERFVGTLRRALLSVSTSVRAQFPDVRKKETLDTAVDALKFQWDLQLVQLRSALMSCLLPETLTEHSTLETTKSGLSVSAQVKATSLGL